MANNITIATGCTYPCDRIYQGKGLTAYTNTTRMPLRLKSQLTKGPVHS